MGRRREEGRGGERKLGQAKGRGWKGKGEEKGFKTQSLHKQPS